MTSFCNILKIIKGTTLVKNQMLFLAIPQNFLGQPAQEITPHTHKKREKRKKGEEGLGAFNNYVDQISPNLDPPPPLEWTIVNILHTVHVTNFFHPGPRTQLLNDPLVFFACCTYMPLHISSTAYQLPSTIHNNKDPRSYLFSIFCLCVEYQSPRRYLKRNYSKLVHSKL